MQDQITIDSFVESTIRWQIHVAATPGKRWMTKDALLHAFHYPFVHLKVKKLIGVVAEDNAEARKLDEHLGFILETRVTGACRGKDLLVYTMTRGQCRYLKEFEHVR